MKLKKLRWYRVAFDIAAVLGGLAAFVSWGMVRFGFVEPDLVRAESTAFVALAVALTHLVGRHDD